MYLSQNRRDSAKEKNRLSGKAEWQLCWLADEGERFCFMDLVLFGCQKHSTVGTQYELGPSTERAS